MSKRKIGVIVGSLRKESFSLKMAKAIMGIAPASLSMELVDIGLLPLYNQDLEDAIPVQWMEFRETMKKFDAVLFVTPEYNRSIPGVLKNAIDVGSRPYGKSTWNGLPAAIVSVSPGLLGAFGANHILRQSLVFLNMPTMPSPEAYISNATQLFSADGSLTNSGTIEYMMKFMDAFLIWIEANSPKKA
jgi:chromate reductase, NAD(P)H dehydrogenase (quinone)